MTCNGKHFYRCLRGSLTVYYEVLFIHLPIQPSYPHVSTYIHILILKIWGWLNQKLVLLNRMFKSGIFWNTGNYVGWFLLRQLHKKLQLCAACHSYITIHSSCDLLMMLLLYSVVYSGMYIYWTVVSSTTNICYTDSLKRVYIIEVSFLPSIVATQ